MPPSCLRLPRLLDSGHGDGDCSLSPARGFTRNAVALANVADKTIVEPGGKLWLGDGRRNDPKPNLDTYYVHIHSSVNFRSEKDMDGVYNFSPRVQSASYGVENPPMRLLVRDAKPEGWDSDVISGRAQTSSGIFRLPCSKQRTYGSCGCMLHTRTLPVQQEGLPTSNSLSSHLRNGVWEWYIFAKGSAFNILLSLEYSFLWTDAWGGVSAGSWRLGVGKPSLQIVCVESRAGVLSIALGFG